MGTMELGKKLWIGQWRSTDQHLGSIWTEPVFRSISRSTKKSLRGWVSIIFLWFFIDFPTSKVPFLQVSPRCPSARAPRSSRWCRTWRPWKRTCNGALPAPCTTSAWGKMPRRCGISSRRPRPSGPGNGVEMVEVDGVLYWFYHCYNHGWSRISQNPMDSHWSWLYRLYHGGSRRIQGSEIDIGRF